MAYRLDLGMWNQVFAVPCALVDRHLKLAGKEQLQVILFALRHAGESFGPGDLAAALGMTEDTALDALDYWTDRGLLALQGEELRPVPQPQEPAARPAPAPQAATAPQPAVESATAQNAASGKCPGGEAAAPEKKRLLRPDGVHLAARLAEVGDVRFLMQEAETTLGKTPLPRHDLPAAHHHRRLRPAVEVTVMLLHYAKEVGKTGTAYIDSVARDWAESNIFTLEAAEQRLQDLSQRRLAWGMVEAAAGLPKRSPSKKEEEAAFRWVYQWGFSGKCSPPPTTAARTTRGNSAPLHEQGAGGLAQRGHPQRGPAGGGGAPQKRGGRQGRQELRHRRAGTAQLF